MTIPEITTRMEMETSISMTENPAWHSVLFLRVMAIDARSERVGLKRREHGLYQRAAATNVHRHHGDDGDLFDIRGVLRDRPDPLVKPVDRKSTRLNSRHLV